MKLHVLKSALEKSPSMLLVPLHFLHAVNTRHLLSLIHAVEGSRKPGAMFGMTTPCFVHCTRSGSLLFAARALAMTGQGPGAPPGSGPGHDVPCDEYSAVGTPSTSVTLPVVTPVLSYASGPGAIIARSGVVETISQYARSRETIWYHRFGADPMPRVPLTCHANPIW